MTRAALFDLDGTLVDSAPAILATFAWVLERHGLQARGPLDFSLIGPPLRDTLRRMTGIDDPATIESLFVTFRERYDAIAIDATPAFPGYAETLAAVRAMGFETIIVTNKRIHPTRLILERQGGAADFSGIYALDAFDPSLPNKAAVVARVIEIHGITVARSVLVGDSVEDASAADANAVPFVAAMYGYGNPDSGKHPVAARLGVLADLPARLADLAL